MIRPLSAAVAAGFGVVFAVSSGAQDRCADGFGCPDDRLNAFVATCLSQGSARDTCPQSALALCQRMGGDDQTTTGLAACHTRTGHAWDLALAEAQARLARAFGARKPDGPALAARFEEDQATWRAHRDAACAFAYGLHGPGSARIVAGAACNGRMTAERTLALWTLMDMWAPDARP
ncbi:MAG: lysozyme inhibitor LprI family protein [Pseudomonadota bacterium]